MRSHEESRIQQACVRWFRMQYPRYARLFFAVPNGGGRSKIEAAIMKGEGVTAGVADMLLLLPSGEHPYLCIEMKTASGRQTREQKAWQADVEAVGGRYAVCRSIEDFMREIKTYLL